jgi:hypothetical protein
MPEIDRGGCQGGAGIFLSRRGGSELSTVYTTRALRDVMIEVYVEGRAGDRANT